MEAIRDFLVNEISLILFFVLWQVFAFMRSKLKDEKRNQANRTIKTISKIIDLSNKLTELYSEVNAKTVILAAIHDSGQVLSPIRPWFKRVLHVYPFNSKYIETSLSQILDISYYEILHRLQQHGDLSIKIDEVIPGTFLELSFQIAEAKSKYMYLLQDANKDTYFIIAIFYFEDLEPPQITDEFKQKLEALKCHYMEQDCNSSTLPKKKLKDSTPPSGSENK